MQPREELSERVVGNGYGALQRGHFVRLLGHAEIFNSSLGTNEFDFAVKCLAVCIVCGNADVFRFEGQPSNAMLFAEVQE